MSKAVKRRQVLLVGLIVVLMSTMALSQLASGNFNAATGFSGKNGFTCTSCHNVPDMGPLGEEQIYDPPAKVELTGLPGAWDLGATYELTVTVTGGPPALPDPAPIGGFEIEADRGDFTPINETAHLIDVYHEDRLAVTYTVEGTLVREWTVAWTAPILPDVHPDVDGPAFWSGLDVLDAEPEPIGFWVAGMAANGNHVVALGLAAGGELGDSVDAIHVTVPPSQAALEGWAEVRLTPPSLVQQDEPVEVNANEPFTLKLKQSDPRATHFSYRLNDGDWNTIQVANFWDLAFHDGLPAGTHTLHMQAISDELVSEVVELFIIVTDTDVVEAPAPALALLVVALFMAAGWRRLQ